MGRKGGKSRSAKKLAACRLNAKKAGRPKKTKTETASHKLT